MSVRNVDVNPSGKYEQICGYSYQDAQHYPGDGGALLVHLEGTPVDSSYWLLDSDYHNYASVYSCFSILGHSGPIWGVRGGIGPKGARGLVLVSIPRVLGMGNPLRPFSDTPD